jgi:hypothetical protein
MDRSRKVDLESLSVEQVDQLSNQIGSKLREIIEQAALEANRIANVYGMQVKLAVQFSPLEEEEKKEG